MKTIKKWIKDRLKKWLGVDVLEQENERLKKAVDLHRTFVAEQMAELKSYTAVDADIGIRSNNTIVLTGVYKKRGFVRFYDIGDGEFNKMVEHLQMMKKHCLIRNLDKPPHAAGYFNIEG